MKFIVEVESLWIEEEQLDEKIKNRVINEVSTIIWSEIQAKVDEQITKVLQKSIEDALTEQVSQKTQKVLNNDDYILKPRYGSPKTVKEVIDSSIAEHLGGAKHVKDAIDLMAKRKAEEIKEHYQMNYAAMLVSKMREQGMINDHVVNALLSCPEADRNP